MERVSDNTGITCILLAGILLMSMIMTPVAATSMTYRGDAQHSGIYQAYSNGIVPNGLLKWSIQTGGAVHSSPAIDNAVIFIGSDDTYVRAIRLYDGSIPWMFKTGGRVQSSPAVVDGFVYVGSDDGKVYAINATTGTQRWQYTTGGPVVSSPAVADGVVYIGSDDGNVYALNAATGTKDWNRPLVSNTRLSPAVANDLVYTGDGEYIYALHADDGTIAWQTPVVITYDEGSPAVGNGLVYIWAEEEGGWLEAYDALTGELRFSQFNSYGYGPNSPAVTPDVVYAGANAIDATTGSVVWDDNLYVCFDSYCSYDGGSSPAVSDGILYVGGRPDEDLEYEDIINYLYALDTDDGSLVWRFETGTDKILTSPAIYAGVVVFGCDDGKIYAVGNQPSPDPSISAVSPAYHWAGTTVKDLTISGTGLLNVQGVRLFYQPAPDTAWETRYATSLRHTSDHELRCDLDLTGIPAGDWTIEARTWDSRSALAQFVVTDTPVIGVMTPSGSVWPAGTYQIITWSEERLKGTDIHIELWKGKRQQARQFVIAESLKAEQGRYEWRIPIDISASDDYWVNISSIAYPAVYDSNDEPLTITEACDDLEIVPLPDYLVAPTDPDGDCIYEDLNGNSRLDFADVVLFFNEMTWIARHEPIAAFDLNGNGRIDFADVVALFGEI